MSTREDRSRVKNKKKFDEGMDMIDWGKRKSTSVRVEEGVLDHTWGRATKYHYHEKPDYKIGDAPAVSFPNAPMEKSLMDYKIK